MTNQIPWHRIVFLEMLSLIFVHNEPRKQLFLKIMLSWVIKSTLLLGIVTSGKGRLQNVIKRIIKKDYGTRFHLKTLHIRYCNQYILYYIYFNTFLKVHLSLRDIVLGVGGDTYTNPVIDSDNPDPAALALPTGGFIVVTTHGTWASDDAFSIYFSTDLVNWQHQGYIFQGRPSVQRLKIQNFKLKDHLKKHKKNLIKEIFCHLVRW